MNAPFQKFALVILIFLAGYNHANSQHRSSGCEHVLRISQDTEIGSYQPDFSNPTIFTIRAKAGTADGNIANTRSLFQFDLSGFDSLQTVDSAFLYLYAATSSAGNNHGTEDGTNESYLRRITTAWDPNTATWNNAPSYTNANEVLLPMTTSANENKEHIDVTQLVQDMVSNPSQSFGFYFVLSIESAYRRMIFASSDHADTNLHPKLIVHACPLVGIDEPAETAMDSKILLMSMSENRMLIESEIQMNSVSIFTLGGQLVESFDANTKRVDQKISAPIGIYLIRVTFSDGSVVNQKLLNF